MATASLKTRAAPRRVRMARQDREKQLLDIAEGLFTRHGFDATSIEDIARAAGVTRPMLYDHFGDKDAILLACAVRAQREFEAVTASAVAAVDPSDFEGVLSAGGEAFFSLLEKEPRRWALLFGGNTALSSSLANKFAELREGTVAKSVEMMRAAVPGVDDQALRAAVHAISGVGEQLGRWWLRTPQVSRNQVVAYYRGFVTGGLQGLRAGALDGRKQRVAPRGKGKS